MASNEAISSFASELEDGWRIDGAIAIMGNETSNEGNASGVEDIFQSALKFPGVSYEACSSMPDFSKTFTIEPSDYRDLWHQLVIIGNGFDLECGLRSRFADFFRVRLEMLKTISRGSDSVKKNAWYESVVSNNLTAWDFMLADEHDGNWCDIEATIASWIVRTNKDDRLSTVVPLVSADAPSESFGSGCENDQMLKSLAAYVRMADNSHVDSSYSREDFCCFFYRSFIAWKGLSPITSEARSLITRTTSSEQEVCYSH